jgi:hypothetical protein
MIRASRRASGAPGRLLAGLVLGRAASGDAVDREDAEAGAHQVPVGVVTGAQRRDQPVGLGRLLLDHLAAGNQQHP